jgi:hypothetical protein
MLAPVALFIYNRLWHTEQTVSALASNLLADQTDLIIFSDGPKGDSNASQVQEVRDYVKTIRGFKSIEIIESDINKGLAKSIISGVCRTLERHEKIVIVEDDMITSPFFLSYMNRALDLYENNAEVISIHGYVYPVSQALPETFFLKGADCWGWATWRRGWELFNPDGEFLLKELKRKKLTKKFDFYGAYPFTRMLKKQISGKNDSWAIRWYASAFLQNKLTLYPGTSLVQNIGNDTSGTHSWDNNRFFHNTLAQNVSIGNPPVKENVHVKTIIANYLRSSHPSVGKKIISRLKFLFR